MPDLRQTEIIRDFSNLTSWEERYKKIIKMGQELGDLPPHLKTEDVKVKGCQSQVWLVASRDPQGKVQFQADSDALIVKGLIALLLRFYSDRKPSEILELQPEFLRELGFEANLSPSRANGLQAMIRQIKYYALAYQALGQG